MERKECNTQREVDLEVYGLYLKNMKKTAELIEVIKPVVWKFDGKIYNARFENEINALLKERGETASVDIKSFSMSHLEIKCQFYAIKDRCFDYVAKDYRGEKCNRCEYLPDSYETIRMAYAWENVPLCGFSVEEFQKYRHSNNGTWYYYDDNCKLRIDSAKIVELMEEEKKDILKEIERLTEELTHLDEYETELKRVKKELEELHNKIPYQFRDFFGLKSYVSQWC